MNEWKLQPGIVLVRIQGICFLAADREARKICPPVREINEVGAEIWELMEKGASYMTIFQTIADVYDIPAEFDLEADIRLFIDSLRELHYITEGDSGL